MKNKIRIFFATDIHGSAVCFRKFINAADFYKAQVIILGGDLTGKALIPIFDKGTHYEAEFLGEKIVLNNEKELEKTIKRIRDMGCYTYLTAEDNWQKLKENPNELERIFSKTVKESIKEWISYAEKKLENKDVICLIQPGNDDSYEIDELLNSKIVINSNEKVIPIGENLVVLSLGYSNITPWKCPRDIPEEELRKKIDQLIERIDSNPEIIFNIHVPPCGTGIDEAPELDDQMRPKVGPGGQILTKPVGSTAVREAILEYQPLLSLHGHIHEAKGFAKLGRTLCINPGSEYHDGILKGVLIQITNNKIRDFIFTSG